MNLFTNLSRFSFSTKSALQIIIVINNVESDLLQLLNDSNTQKDWNDAKKLVESTYKLNTVPTTLQQKIEKGFKS